MPANRPSAAQSKLASSYEAKPLAYFEGCREDIVRAMPTGPESLVLEVGCGDGSTGRFARAMGKAGAYVGIEISVAAAEVAAQHLSEVVVGDVEQMDLSRFHGRFDVLVLSEVLEHLSDPWVTLAALAKCLKPGGLVYASSPNISHRWVIAGLIGGRFDYAADGVFDRTHLRWFTPLSFRRMFEGAGFAVESIGPLVPPGLKARLLDRLTGGRFTHLFTVQIMLVGRRLR